MPACGCAALPVEIDQARQEAGKRLAAAGRGDEQRVAALALQGRGAEAGGRAGASRAARTSPRTARAAPASGPRLTPLFQRSHRIDLLDLAFSFTNSGHRLTRIAILRCV